MQKDGKDGWKNGEHTVSRGYESDKEIVMHVYVCCHFSRVCLFVTPRTILCQATLSMGFFR